MTVTASARAQNARPWLRGYEGKTIAVTGADGFIGGATIAALSAITCRIERIELRDATERRRRIDADLMLHFAARTSAGSSPADAATSFDHNVMPFRRVLSMCAAAAHPPFIVFAGTVTQAGIPATIPVNEDAVDRPVLPYDEHKLLCENELKTAVAASAVRGASLRLANVYGPGGRAGKRDRDVLNRMVRDAVDGRALTVFGTGEYLRDYVFIDDVVDAFLLAGLRQDALSGRHFVIGSGSGITIREAARMIADRAGAMTGTTVPVIFDDSQPLTGLQQRQFVADSTRFINATGWRPSWSFRDGIEGTIEAMRCE